MGRGVRNGCPSMVQAVLRLEFWLLIGLAVVSVRVIVSMAPHIVLGPQFGNSTANND